MFKRKKELKQIQQEKEQLEQIKEQLIFIQQELNDNSPRIDIDNVYVWEAKGIYHFVNLHIHKIQGKTWNGLGPVRTGYHSILTDIFTDRIIHEKESLDLICEKEFVKSKNYKSSNYFAYFYPIYELNHNLLGYADKKVPLYILRQLYFDVNEINMKSKVLQIRPTDKPKKLTSNK
ncbi:MAG: hypothetical protein E7165_02055 [Firmicutes bacterium]|nr:hypothetical protein [Bacillota bacterium]